MRHLLLLCTLLLAGATIARSQGDSLITTGITGTVTDAQGQPLIGATVHVVDHQDSTTTDLGGQYTLSLAPGEYDLTVSYIHYADARINDVLVRANRLTQVDQQLSEAVELDEVVVVGYAIAKRENASAASTRNPNRNSLQFSASPTYSEPRPPYAGEDYAHRDENGFTLPQNEPLSTFGADVDAAAYANARRFINDGILPPADAVRTEEFVNYFDYAYPQPTGDAPVAFATALGDCPWNPDHHLLRIGLQARDVDVADLPPANLVFLLDVSGSMAQPNKLGLVKAGLRQLVETLRPTDRVSLVVYAGAAGVVLEPTPGSAKDTILRAIDRLEAGGSTAGAAGIKLAYRLAERHFLPEGNNRIVLATDGDFNVGTTGKQSLADLVAAKRSTGVYLSVLGFGSGNYQDARMQTLAEHGNGNAYYVDNLLEARKVLVEEFGGTLFTLAEDVKLQVEFNPARVGAYRLVGYESRLLEAEDFNDDTKDAGDVGAGHTVTALYELIPAGTESSFLPRVDELKYQRRRDRRADDAQTAGDSGEWATVRMKYKRPGERRSEAKVERVVTEADAIAPNSEPDFDWVAAVAAWSLLLQDSEFVVDGYDYAALLESAEAARGTDERGYRAEALRLMAAARDLGEELELVEAERN